MKDKSTLLSRAILIALVFSCCCFIQKNTHAQIAVSPTGSVPHASAGLDIDFNNKGLLVPRVDLSTAVFPAPGPATSLLVWNTQPGNEGFFYNAGDETTPDWKKLSTSSGISTVETEAPLTGTGVPGDAVGLIDGAAAGQILKWNGSAWQLDNDDSNTGTVTSVGLSLPGIFNVSGSPVTASGTLTGALANQNANTVFAGPASGGAAAPAFRSLVAADVPDLSAGYIKNQASLQSASQFHISGAGRTATAFQSPVYTRADAGTVAIRPNTNSTTAVQLQNAAGTSILNIDATNQTVGIGTTVNSENAELDVVNPSGLGRIRVSGVQTGYTQADILLQTGTTHSPEGRGTGIYTQNQGNNTTWYFGNPYSSPDMFVINRKAGTGLLAETAQNNASGVLNVLSITGGGNVGIGTAGSANKLNVVNSTLNGGTAGMIAINSTYTLDQPPADIRAAIAGIGHYTTTANVRSAGIYGWVPTGGHGTLAAAAIFDRPDNNRRIFIGGSQTAISTPSIHVYNTSTTGTDFIVDNTGRVGIGTVSPSTPLHVNGTATATALAGAFDQSASGYVRIGNMQIAWGTTTLASGQGWTTGSSSTRFVLCNQTITFPAAFISAPTVTFGMIDGAIAARSAYVSYFLPTTTNVNTIYLTSPIAHFETSAVIVHWTAIGRWQ